MDFNKWAFWPSGYSSQDNTLIYVLSVIRPTYGVLHMMEITLKLKVPDHWIGEITERFQTPIKILGIAPDGEDGTRELIEIDEKDHQHAGEIVKSIKDHPLVSRIETTESEGKIIGSVYSKCATCNALTSANCFLKSAISNSDGTVQWNLITSDKKALASVINGMKSRGLEVELKKVGQLEKEELLTDRQKEILKIAYDRGYFDTPKRISIRELADISDVSISTLSEIIRKGEKKIVHQFLSRL